MKNIILIIALIITFSCKKETKIHKNNSLNISCSNLVEPNKELELYPIITEKCKLKNYIFITKGHPDDKGRYYWEYELFETKNDKVVKIKNSSIFNDIDKLEKIINSEIIKQYKRDIEIPEIKECMKFVKMRNFKLDELQISFNENKKIQFIAKLNTPPFCTNINLYFATFELDLINKYLK